MLTVNPRSAPAFGRRSESARAALPAGFARAGWKGAGAAALLFSTVAWASLPSHDDIPTERHQWAALGVSPLANGGETGLRMAATDAAEPVEFVPQRKAAPVIREPDPPAQTGPVRIRGHVGDGLYWSLRAAGASPQVAAQYLAALATEIDVGGDVSLGDSFDMVLQRPEGALLYAGIDRIAAPDLQLVRWNTNGRSRWIDAARADQPAQVSNDMAWPVAGRITSYFGYRVHPIFRFRRFHSGVDFGADWGSPIVAAADGQVVRAGWAGGYGRQVRIAHGDGVQTSYSHMSSIAAAPGSFVRAGEVIGYVGSSGFSTGPHLHYEVIRAGVKVNPLGVRFASAPVVDHKLAAAVKARLSALMRVAAKG